MTIVEFLSRLRSLDVQVWIEADRLRLRAPAGVLTSALRTELAERKQEVIAFLRGAELAVLSAAPSIPTASRDQELPLSFAQQRLWFLDQLEPGSPFYNISTAVRLEGRLHLAALQQGLDEIMRRHEILRTRFVAVDGRPIQVIAPPGHVALPLVDLEVFSTAERQTQARQLALEESRQPFDLAQAPLWRVALLRLSETEVVLLLTMHHIVTDGWSMSVFIRELASFYRAFSTDQPSALTRLPIQYADYAVWQRQGLQDQTLTDQLVYWRQRLDNAPAALELPTDRPRPAIQTFQGARLDFTLPGPLAEALMLLSQAEQVTLFMLLLAAFDTLLYRYTSQTDIVVGSPITNRGWSETEGLIGFFVNTLALRTDLAGRPTFRELLARVREFTLADYAHQDLPFEKLVEELQPERSLSRTPLFQVMFVFQNAPVERLELPGLTLSPLEIESGTAKFDLTLVMMETAAGLSGTLEYNTDLFDRGTVVRMQEHFQRLLEGVAANPDERIADLPLLTEAEQHRVLIEWNNTQVEYSHAAPHCMPEVFQAQVEKTPDAVALVFENAHLSYDRLNRRANQVAHELQRLGVGPEVLVGICMERSLEMVAGLLGILKAGGAYVPLDPTYPSDRLTFMLQDTQALVLLTQPHLVERLPPQQSAQLVYVDTSGEAGQGCEENLTNTALPENMAYIIYTSGSTGTPKGVAITHRSAVALIRWGHTVFGPELLAGTLASTSICFDLSVFELFVPLSCGASVILAENALQLPTLPAAQAVTLVNTVPSALKELLNTGLPDSVRVVNLAGEPLQTRLVQQIYQQKTVERVYDLYGPSEDTTYSTYALRSAAGPDTIGRPIANTQSYLLDNNLKPVPIGVPGELYLGGAGLARGYLNRAHLTAERFIPNPFSDKAGSRLYKTGDLARYRPDGNLEFLGRTDHQVKIRGYRIELGEIEAALRQHPAVRDCLVLARETEPAHEQKQLVAYLVPPDGLAPTVTELRSFLKVKLPEYMLPGAFVMLAALPLTPSGKIDRRALPAPDQIRPEIEPVFVAPRTPLEEALAGIWANVLNLKQVGVLDNFFELGGHSLLATRVISRVRQAFQVELPLRSLFEEPTVTGLAGRIEAARWAGQALSAPPLRPVARDGHAPLSFAQQRLWFLNQLEPGSSAYNIPIAVRLTGRLDVTALCQSLGEITRRHEALRTTFGLVNGQPVQIIASTASLALPVVDLRELRGPIRPTVAQQLAMEEAQRPFDLESGPLLRADLIQLDEAEHVLLVTMHHIVSDAWSLSLFVRELAALYRSFARDKARTSAPEHNRLVELPIQYADFAVWQRQWLQGSVLETQLAYWRQQLKGSLPVLELPTDRPRPSVKTYHGARQAFTLDQTTTEALRALSRQEGVTLFMTLLAAFATVLHRYTGQADIIVGSPIANRNRMEIEGLIGFFTNTLAVRVDLSGNPSFRELLARVREVMLGAYAHQDLPFEKLVEELHPERNMSRDPLFQVMFVLQNVQSAGIDPLDLPDLRLSPLETGSTTAKFDLTLFVVETGRELSGTVEYNTDLFEADTLARWLGHFQTFLADAVARPQQPISDLPLLTETERDQLRQWNDTAVAYPREQRLHDLVEQQVAAEPDAIAVVVEYDQHLSYAALDRRANQLAHHLQGLGVGPEVPVGVCLDRSLDMAVGVLGILKAGGIYVPLDPSYPQERLAFMLAETRSRVLLAHRRLLGNLPEIKCPVVCLDTDWPQLENQPQSAPQCASTPDNLLYILYTSGSTGKPKGVAMRQQPIINLIHWQTQSTRLEQPARTLQFASLNFDVSCQEMFFTWSSGGTLVLISEDTRRDMVRLLQVLNETAIERVFLPFVALQHLAQVAEEHPAEAPRQLREIITAGEQLQVTPQIQSLLNRVEGGVLHNQYGPTEGHAVTALTLSGRPETWPILPPIGQPIANVTLSIVDSHLQAVPVGVPGELLIGNSALARGYFDRPDLTAERFSPDPASTLPGARVYRTGDLARYRPDGSIEFLGRMDHQVKVRGFRIELGEVEAALRQHPAVREAVVMAREDQPGNRRLVAYLVPQAATPDISEVRRALQEQLPDYMVPSAFVVLDALPLTPNGKVDRRALPVPEQTGLDLAGARVAPRDTLELRLVHIWEELLSVQPIGIQHNFFELGGHSLLAVRLMAHIEQEFGARLPLVTLFEGATVAHLAATLRLHSPAIAPTSSLVRLQAGQSNKRPLFFIHPAGGNVLCYADLLRYLGPEQPFYGLQAPGLTGEQEPYTQVEAIARHHVDLLRTVQPNGPYLLGGWSLGGIVAYEMAQQFQVAGQSVALLAMIDSRAPKGDWAFKVDDAALLAGLAQDLGLSLASSMSDGDYPEQLDLDGQLAYLLEKAKQANVVPSGTDLAQVRRLFHVFRNDLQAARWYAPRAYPGPVTLFKASEQRGEPEENLGWGPLVKGGLTVYTIPGDHETIVLEPNVPVLVEKLKEQLRAAEMVEVAAYSIHEVTVQA